MMMMMMNIILHCTVFITPEYIGLLKTDQTGCLTLYLLTLITDNSYRQ